MSISTHSSSSSGIPSSLPPPPPPSSSSSLRRLRFRPPFDELPFIREFPWPAPPPPKPPALNHRLAFPHRSSGKNCESCLLKLLKNRNDKNLSLFIVLNSRFI